MYLEKPVHRLGLTGDDLFIRLKSVFLFVSNRIGLRLAYRFRLAFLFLPLENVCGLGLNGRY